MFNLNNISKIKGYSALKEADAKMFQAFLKNFISSWGMEARETIEPTGIKYLKENGRLYLRFDYKIYNKKEWLHVKSSMSWY